MIAALIALIILSVALSVELYVWVQRAKYYKELAEDRSKELQNDIDMDRAWHSRHEDTRW